MLHQFPAGLGRERVASLADQARIRFHTAALPISALAIRAGTVLISVPN